MKKELNKMKNEITYNQLENILSNTLNKLADEDKRYLDKINTEKRRLEKAKRKRNDKKIRDKIGFEYKDRNKEW